MSNDPHWIEHMHLKKGALHRDTHTPMGRNISPTKLQKAMHSRNKTVARRANVAETLKGLHK